MLRSTITQIGVPDDRSQSALKAGMLRSQMWHVNGKLHRVSIRPQSGDAAQLEWRSFDAFMIVSQSALKAGKLRSARRKPLSPSRCLNPPSKRGCCAALNNAGKSAGSVSIRPQSGDAAQQQRQESVLDQLRLNPPSKRGCCAANRGVVAGEEALSQSALKAGMLRSVKQLSSGKLLGLNPPSKRGCCAAYRLIRICAN